LPSRIPRKGLLIWERQIGKGVEVIVLSSHGSVFNRLLTIVVGKMLGKRARVRYSDFVLQIQNMGKESAGKRVEEILSVIKEMDRDTIGKNLPLPPSETWKFSSVLPNDVLTDMILSEHYHVEEFMKTIRTLPILSVPKITTESKEKETGGKNE
jgi:hypothetical protein